MSMFTVEFTQFLREWFCGPLNLCYRFREFGYCVGPLKKAPFVREPYALEGFLLKFRGLVEYGDGREKKEEKSGRRRDWFRELNAFLGIASYDNDDLKNPIYDALHYDFDWEEDPSKAVSVAFEFARSLKERFGCDSVIYLSGIRGAHVVVPLKAPTDWEGYELTWRALIAPYKFLPKKLIDDNMLQHNRLDRIPFTYNIKVVKEGDVERVVRGYSRIVLLNGKPLSPGDFSWDLFEPLDITQVEVYRVMLPEVPRPKPIRVRGRRRPGVKLPSSIEELVSSEAVPPCVRNLIDAFMKAGDLDHYQRMALVLYLKWVGFSVDDVVEFFKRYARDFNERITRYQVEYLYGMRGSKKDYLMYSCRKLKELGICLECGWDRNPITYTYRKAEVNPEVMERFYNLLKGRESRDNTQPRSGGVAGNASSKSVTREKHSNRLENGGSHHKAVPSWVNPYAAKVLEFIEETGLTEFSYDDFKRWLEGREGRLLNASEWQGWERRLRQLVSEGMLGRKYLVNSAWVDYGTKQVATPPSKTVRFYVIH